MQAGKTTQARGADEEDCGEWGEAIIEWGLRRSGLASSEGSCLGDPARRPKIDSALGELRIPRRRVRP
jgi:hypothetical protein